MVSSASSSDSQSFQAPYRRRWLPFMSLAILISLSVASIIGVSLSAVTFSSTDELVKPGHGIAQSFVMFASMLSLFYIPLHILAAWRGERIYFEPPIPSFNHQLYISATIVIRMAAVMWASATVAVAVGIHRGGGGENTVRLNVDMFACATGLLSGGIILGVIQLADRPFALPRISATSTRSSARSEEEFDEKTGVVNRESSSTDGTLRGSPAQGSKASSKASSAKSSWSTSTSRSGSRKMSRTRRYVLEAPSTVSTSPLKRQNSGGTGNSSHPPSNNGGDLAKLEAELVPSASESESFFAASTANSPDQPEKNGQSVMERPVTPETVVYSGNGGKVSPRRPTKTPAALLPRRMAASSPSPSPFRFGGRSGSGSGRPEQTQVGDLRGEGYPDAVSPSTPVASTTPPVNHPPAPPSPPPPPPTYYVPGAWVRPSHIG